jgi:hypothetical protein
LGAPQYGELVMGDEGISWGYIDYQHPIFEGIFADKPALESPNFMGHFRLLGTGGNAVISFRNGEVFLKEVRIGEGAILIFTAGLGDEWGDFSNRGIFAPLLHRAVVYLGSRGENGIKPLVAGTPIEYWVETSQKKYRLCLPDGQSMDLIPSVEGKMLKLKYSDTSIAGICILQQNDSLFAEFAVNPDVQGSKLERETKDKDRDNITISDEKNLADIVQVGRLGQELWRWFLLIGLGCLLLEMLIVRLSQKG